MGSSIYTTYGQFVGGIELEDYAESFLVKVLSIAFGLIVGIILLNVVIAIVSESWTKSRVESEKTFWLLRMEFLMLFKFSTEESSVDKFLQGIDDLLSEICKPFWPSKDYWGSFDSFFDRMLSDDVGSFQWQITNEIKTTLPRKKSPKLIMSTAPLLLVIFLTIACIWFVIGLLSIGILWPRPIRRFIFSAPTSAVGLEGDSNASNESGNQAITRCSTMSNNQRSDTNTDQPQNDILLTVTRLSNDIDMLLKQIKRAESEVTLLVPSTMVLDSGIEN
eukprot:454996_1